MTRCRILHTIVPVYPDRVVSPQRAVSFCDEHHMPLEGVWSSDPNKPPMCPIGRIEQATDEAIERISAAQREKTT
jgi:hypothetical protein